MLSYVVHVKKKYYLIFVFLNCLIYNYSYIELLILELYINRFPKLIRAFISDLCISFKLI